jgi:hypothetical protein
MMLPVGVRALMHSLVMVITGHISRLCHIDLQTSPLSPYSAYAIPLRGVMGASLTWRQEYPHGSLAAAKTAKVDLLY